MSTETILLETGDPESLTVTIKALLAANWGDGTATGGQVPKFIADDGVTVTQAAQKMINNAITINELSSGQYDPNFTGGWAAIMMVTTLKIDIYATSATLKALFEDRVNKILNENQPDMTGGLKKSNGTDMSRARAWANPAITFISTKLESGIMRQKAAFSTAQLKILWEKVRT